MIQVAHKSECTRQGSQTGSSLRTDVETSMYVELIPKDPINLFRNFAVFDKRDF